MIDRSLGPPWPERDSLARLLETLQSLNSRPEEAGNFPSRVFSGLETCSQSREYYWDGRSRLHDPQAPFVVWQYTLAGRGAFREHSDAAMRPLLPGHVFTTIVPSDNAYFLPADSPRWTFFWLIIDHPYVAQRFRDRTRTAGSIWPVSPQHALVMRALELFDASRATLLRDDFAEEGAIFQFMLEWERFAHDWLYPPAPREKLLDDVRREVLARFGRQPPTVEQIAEQRGLSRTRFAHFFRKTTGLTPARFITQLRLDEAARLLTETDLKLERIARQTGFADATHFGKVFRRNFFATPTKYRHSRRLQMCPKPVDEIIRSEK